MKDPESKKAKKYLKLKKELEEDDGARDEFHAIHLQLLKDAKKE